MNNAMTFFPKPFEGDAGTESIEPRLRCEEDGGSWGVSDPRRTLCSNEGICRQLGTSICIPSMFF